MICRHTCIFTDLLIVVFGSLKNVSIKIFTLLSMDLLSAEYESSSEEESLKISTKRTDHENEGSQIVKRSKIDLAPDVSLEVSSRGI